MDWSQFQRIDPQLLLGLINTELRNHADSLQDLCRTHEIDQAELCAYLASANYHFQAEQNQFR
jgi:hypothetical protein|tara:strand:+ start:323 stop:511 length:189 start_codon:yes stop_codon:yes gene_type:complete